MRRFLWLGLLAGMLAGCGGNQARDTSGRALGADAWAALAPASSALAIAGPADHRHQMRKFPDRYQEQITFTNGVGLQFEQLYSGVFAAGSLPTDMIARWYQADSIKQEGFTLKRDLIERSDDAYVITDAGNTRTCTQLVRLYGSDPFGPGAINGRQYYRLLKCEPNSPTAARATRTAVIAIADRLNPERPMRVSTGAGTLR